MVNVLDKRELKKMGYNPKVYYCGNYTMQKYWTKFRNHLQDKGIPFPYNEACFLHDIAYSKKPNLIQKFKIDLAFYNDMLKLLEYKSKISENIAKNKTKLRLRALLYFIIVTLATPFYMWQGKIKR
jgi:hypothetical protein